MDEPIFDYGGIASPEDGRDWDLGTIQTPVQIPAVWLPDMSKFPVYNQGAQPSCGGHAGTKLQNILLNLGTNLSPRFVYALCKKVDGIPNIPGTTGRAIMQVLQKYGVCTNDLFPNDISLPFAEYADWTKIPQAAFIDGLTRRIGPYAQVTDLSPDGLKQAIYQNTAVLVLKKPWAPSSWIDQSYPSGHFFVLDGYSKPIRFANSFGIGWQQNGDFFLQDEDIATIKEAWVAVEPTAPIITEPLGPVTLPDTATPDQIRQQEVSLLQRIVVLLKQMLGIQ